MKRIAFLNTNLFPIYYMTENVFENIWFKYGIVSEKDFLEDLSEWKIMTIAGRLQKPVWIT